MLSIWQVIMTLLNPSPITAKRTRSLHPWNSSPHRSHQQSERKRLVTRSSSSPGPLLWPHRRQQQIECKRLDTRSSSSGPAVPPRHQRIILTTPSRNHRHFLKFSHSQRRTTPSGLNWTASEFWILSGQTQGYVTIAQGLAYYADCRILV